MISIKCLYKSPFRFCTVCAASSSSAFSTEVNQSLPTTAKSPIRKEKRALNVAVIGPPNVGKSALTNAVVRASYCAVSKCIDTTRMNSTTTLTENDCQLVVVDSPGLVGVSHAKKVIGTNSESQILVDPERALKHAEHVLVVQDVTAPGAYIHHRVLHLLYRYAHIPTSLVLNKVDLVKRRTDLLRLTEVLADGVVDGQPMEKKTQRIGHFGAVKTPHRNEPIEMSIHPPVDKSKRDEKWQIAFNKVMSKPAYKCTWSETKHLFMDQSGWAHFKSVFFVSALTGEGIDGLRAYLQTLSAPADEWHFEDTELIRKNARKLCQEHTRSKLLDLLPSYVAYALRVHIVEWEVMGEQIRMIIEVNCDKERSARLVAKINGELERAVTSELEQLFGQSVELRIRAKYEKKIVEAVG